MATAKKPAMKKSVAGRKAATKPVATKKTAAKTPATKKAAPGKAATTKTAGKRVPPSKPTAGTKATKAARTTRAAARTSARSGAGEGGDASTRTPGTPPRLLSGGNPQIPKGYGDEVVQAYIRAMPGWKRAVGERLDALVARTVPGVHKAVKWNTPLYGIQGQGWFLAFHCFDRYIKVTFFRSASLDPVPPVASKMAQTRYLHVAQDGQLDQARFVEWVRQASRLPGEMM